MLAASTTTDYAPNTGSLGPLYFGGGEHGPGTVCDGELSQIAYYNVALPPSAIAAHFASGTGGAAQWWEPTSSDLPWQWEIDHALNTSSASDMGTGITAWNGDTSPGDNPRAYDIDAVLNSASTVSTLHLEGNKAVCYIEVGSAGNHYSAAQEGIPTTYNAQLSAGGDLGVKMPGYNEYYLDILNSSTVSIIESMIDQQCAAKGFDAVETDIDEEYGETSDFGLTKVEEETYMATLANYMHGLGLAWMIKDSDDTGDSHPADMEPLADLVLTEQCNQYATCSLLDSYIGKKPILNAEYAPQTTSEFCAADIANGFIGEVFPVALTGGRSPCR